MPGASLLPSHGAIMTAVPPPEALHPFSPMAQTASQMPGLSATGRSTWAMSSHSATRYR
jgi:hypothetical protein